MSIIKTIKNYAKNFIAFDCVLFVKTLAANDYRWYNGSEEKENLKAAKNDWRHRYEV